MGKRRLPTHCGLFEDDGPSTDGLGIPHQMGGSRVGPISQREILARPSVDSGRASSNAHRLEPGHGHLSLSLVRPLDRSLFLAVDGLDGTP